MDKKIIILIIAVILIIIVIVSINQNKVKDTIGSDNEERQNENAITELYQKSPEELTNDEFIQKADYEKELESKEKASYGEYDIKE